MVDDAIEGQPMTEAKLLVEILTHVTAIPNAIFWRQNTGVFRALNSDRVIRSSANGIADILGVYAGVPIAIECKSARGTLSTAQMRFRYQWMQAGGVHIVARRLDDVLDVIQQIADDAGVISDATSITMT